LGPSAHSNRAPEAAPDFTTEYCSGGASLSNDTSALILVGEDEALAEFVTGVEPFGGKIIETDLDEKDIKALKAEKVHA
jgi:uncharacterized membrane protein